MGMRKGALRRTDVSGDRSTAREGGEGVELHCESLRII